MAAAASSAAAAGSGLLHSPVLAAIGLISLVLATLATLLATAYVRLATRPPSHKALFQDYNVAIVRLPWPLTRVVMALFRVAEVLPNYLVPPPQRALDIVSSFMRNQVLITITELGVPDALKGGAMVGEDIAITVGAKPEALGRVLDTAVCMGLLDSTPLPSSHGPIPLYSLNALSAVLCKDHPNTVRPLALLFRDQMQPWRALTDSLRTGKVAYDLIHPDQPPGSFWTRLEKDADQLATFNESMTAMNNLGNVTAILTDYPWRKYRRVLDVGGGLGGFLRAALQWYPSLKGVLMDLPHVVEAAEKVWQAEAAEVMDAGRTKFAGGSFFEASDIPAAESDRDIYVLRNILHDWHDPECLKILHNIRTAIGTLGARLAIIEMALVDELPATMTPRRLSDLHMMAMYGARERTRPQFEGLLRQAGFRLARVVPTRSMLFVLEAVPV